jgi:NDP-sugar pyrophosphorylase family protein
MPTIMSTPRPHAPRETGPTALLLCGGLGTRLRSVTDRPKGLIDVAGWPFLRYHLEQLRPLDPERIVFLTGHGGEQIEAAFGPADLRRVFLRDPVPLGTGGALAQARPHAGEHNWIANGDSFVDVDPHAVLSDFHPGTVLLVAAQVDDRADYGGIEIASDGRVTAFVEKGRAGSGWINAGVYVLGRELLDEIPDGPSSFECDHLPRWAGEGKLFVHPVRAFFRDIGTPERLAAAQLEFVAVRRRFENF